MSLAMAATKPHSSKKFTYYISPGPPPCSSPSSASSSSSSSSGDDDDSPEPLLKPKKNPCPGRRVIGRRVYDSVYGVSCHWCRQKTVEDHVHCCCCTIAFCGGCLKNRHGELIHLEMPDHVDWVCPKCRGGCGRGCDNCCNCGPCRKAQGLEPTGLLVHTARSKGFDNVHDYLIHVKTGESLEALAERKRGRGWCQTAELSAQERQSIKNNLSVRDMNTFSLVESCRKQGKACQAKQPEHGIKKLAGGDAMIIAIGAYKKQEKACQFEFNKQPDLSSALEGNRAPKRHICPSLEVERLSKRLCCESGSDDSKVERNKCGVLPSTKESQELISVPLWDMIAEPANVPVKVHETTTLSCQLVQVKDESGNEDSEKSHVTECSAGSQPTSLKHEVQVKDEPVNECSERSQVAESLAGSQLTSLKHDSAVAKSSPQDMPHLQVEPKRLSSCNSSPETVVHQLVNVKEEMVDCPLTTDCAIGNGEQLMRVKEEVLTFCLPTISHGGQLVPIKGELPLSSSQADIHILHSQGDSMAAAFSRSENDAIWSRFSLEFSLPSSSVNDEPEGNETGFLASSKFEACSDQRSAGVCLASVNEEGSDAVEYAVSSGQLASSEAEACYPSVLDVRNAMFKVRAEKVGSPGAQSCLPVLSKVKPEFIDTQESCSHFPLSCQVKAEIVDSYENQRPARPVKIENLDVDTQSLQMRSYLSNLRYCQPESPLHTPAMKQEPYDLCRLATSTVHSLQPRALFQSKSRREESCQQPGAAKTRKHPVNQVKTAANMGSQTHLVICVDDDDDDTSESSPALQVSSTMSSASGVPTHLWSAEGFRKKLESKLSEPFDSKELESLSNAANHRMPVYRVRETRQGSSRVISHEEGYSYLDHHPELDVKLQSTKDPEGKLNLLRGFFFWLQHASMKGAFKPWNTVMTETQRQDEDCMEIEGPDCEILAVVCSIDEEQNSS